MKSSKRSLVAAAISLYILLVEANESLQLTFRINNNNNRYQVDKSAPTIATDAECSYSSQAEQSQTPTESGGPSEQSAGPVETANGATGGQAPVSPEQRASSAATSQAQRLSAFMDLERLPGKPSNNVTCNDGSQIGYYKRLNRHSKSWVIFLQGGGYCASAESCQRRWQQSPNLMSSNFWPQTTSVDGILSSDAKMNPYLWNANHIYIPYCSSDSWSGLSAGLEAPNGSTRFAFMGSQIIEQVLHSLYDELPNEASLYGAKFILLAGESAGAAGVVMNLDKISDFIGEKLASNERLCSKSARPSHQTGGSNDCRQQPEAAPLLRGIADSGWFIDNDPYDMGKAPISAGHGDMMTPFQQQQQQHEVVDCERQVCKPALAIKQAMSFWNGQVAPECAKRHLHEPWLCYFAYRTYQTLRTPLFVVQWLFDEAQLMADNIFLRPDSQAEWAYVKRVAKEVRDSLDNVSAIFAPSCFSHSMITKKSWNQISINGLKLPHILNTWEEQSLIGGAGASGSGGAATDNNSKQIGQQQVRYLEPASTGLQRHKHDQRASQDVAGATINQHESSRTLRSVPSGTQSPTLRPRGKKRKRNQQPQQQQQSKAKQARQSQPGTAPSPLGVNNNNNNNNDNNQQLLSPNFHHLSPTVSVAASGAQNQADSIIIGRVRDSGRSGRSASVEDATLVLSNNVPGDEATQVAPSSLVESRLDSSGRWIISSPFEHVFQAHFSSRIAVESAKQSGSPDNAEFNRFRLIDSCSWPQCNRECPIVDSDVLMGGPGF